ncbi:putative pentatricopeptide repeat-containing protein [Quercus suber]|uniref:Pentatricopeptide repeat-containing protein n=1 Tax=Quercus suber TaxID=58331 RepID=A0AAW0LRF9_QUESU
MQLARCNPDAVSIVSVLSACSKLQAVLLGKSARAFSVRKQLASDLKVTNALLAFYSDYHQLSSSVQLFNMTAIRNVVSWNTLISEKTTAFLHQMHKDGMELDFVTLISILPVFSERKDLLQGMAIHGFAIKTGIASDVSY